MPQGPACLARRERRRMGLHRAHRRRQAGSKGTAGRGSSGRRARANLGSLYRPSDRGFRLHPDRYRQDQRSLARRDSLRGQGHRMGQHADLRAERQALRLPAGSGHVSQPGALERSDRDRSVDADGYPANDTGFLFGRPEGHARIDRRPVRDPFHGSPVGQGDDRMVEHAHQRPCSGPGRLLHSELGNLRAARAVTARRAARDTGRAGNRGRVHGQRR